MFELEKGRELPHVSNAVELGALAVDQNIIGDLFMTNIPASIKRQAMDRDFQPSVRIGKTGVTDSIVEEIKSQLVKRSLVKIKINRGLYERGDIAPVWEQLALATSSVVVLSRGNVGVLWSK